MHKFEVFLRLGKMVFIVSRLNKIFGKSSKEWN